VGGIATRTGMFTVACPRCERHGHYRLDTLIGRHGNAGMVVQRWRVPFPLRARDGSMKFESAVDTTPSSASGSSAGPSPSPKNGKFSVISFLASISARVAEHAGG